MRVTRDKLFCTNDPSHPAQMRFCYLCPMPSFAHNKIRLVLYSCIALAIAGGGNGRVLDGQVPASFENKLVESLFMYEAPAASTRMEIPQNVFLRNNTMGDAALKIQDALNYAGYTDQGWFLVGQKDYTGGNAVVGFAVVTRLEQVDDRGLPMSGATRYSINPSPASGSFLDALKLALKGAPNGKYRVFMIWVKNGPMAQLITHINSDDFQEYLRKGTKAPLLGPLKKIPFLAFQREGGCYVFVYEFERSAIDGEVHPVITGLTAEQHLKAAGISKALGIPGGA
jgi:hypothetical protein